MTLSPTEKLNAVRLEFTARELDTDDAAEWDHICDSIETQLCSVRDRVLAGDSIAATLTIVVRAEVRR